MDASPDHITPARMCTCAWGGGGGGGNDVKKDFSLGLYSQLFQINIYYCMTERGMQGNIPFEINHIGLTEGRDNTEVENGIFPRIARPEELQLIMTSASL